MDAPATVLFVYGTLKRGARNHGLLADQRFLGVATTAPKYRVFDLGPFPGLVRDNATGLSVHGELFAVSECALGELDDFEGVPDLFTRERIEVDGRADVWAYFANVPVPAGARSGDRWPVPDV